MSASHFATADLSIVVPTRDEAATLQAALRTLGTWLSTTPLTAEVIVVDDASRDDTGRVVDAGRGSFVSLRVLRCDRRGGLGRSVRLGMLMATGRYCLYLPAAQADDIVLAGRLVTAAEHDDATPAVIVATPADAAPPPRTRRIDRLVLGRTPPPGACTVFTHAAADAVFRRCRTDGRGIAIEALAVAQALGLDVRLVPVDLLGATASNARQPTVVDLVRLRPRLRTLAANASGQHADARHRLGVG